MYWLIRTEKNLFVKKALVVGQVQQLNLTLRVLAYTRRNLFSL